MNNSNNETAAAIILSLQKHDWPPSDQEHGRSCSKQHNQRYSEKGRVLIISALTPFTSSAVPSVTIITIAISIVYTAAVASPIISSSFTLMFIA